MKLRILSILGLALSIGFGSAIHSSGQQNIRSIVATQGLARVGSEDLLVTVLVAVGPGENARAKASRALADAHPGARELDHDLFTTTGLDWNSGPTGFPASGVPVHYNASGEPAPAHATVSDAMAMWAEVTTSYFQYGPLGSTTRAPSLVRESPGPQVRDGFNDVAWGDIKGRGTLGVTWSTTSNPPEFDMMLDNKDFTWAVTTRGGPSPAPDEIDLVTVAAHEFGHALGLGHTESSPSLMEAYYNGAFIRQLGDDDVAGVSCLYPEDGYVCGDDGGGNGGGDPEPGEISVADVVLYRTGRRGRDLRIDVHLVNSNGSPAAGVVVEGELKLCGATSGATATDVSDSSGVASFRLRNAGSNAYEFTVLKLDGSSSFGGEVSDGECL